MSALAFTFTTLASVATLTSTTLAFALIAFATLAAAASLPGLPPAQRAAELDG